MKRFALIILVVLMVAFFSQTARAEEVFGGWEKQCRVCQWLLDHGHTRRQVEKYVIDSLTKYGNPDTDPDAVKKESEKIISAAQSLTASTQQKTKAPAASVNQAITASAPALKPVASDRQTAPSSVVPLAQYYQSQPETLPKKPILIQPVQIEKKEVTLNEYRWNGKMENISPMADTDKPKRR